MIQIKKAATDVTIQIRLFDALTGEPKTGVTIANLDLWYIRVEDDEDVTISSKVDLAALAALTDAHADSSAYEIGKGYYRIDLPDAVFASGATTASIIIEDGEAGTILSERVDFQLINFDPYTLLPAEVGSPMDLIDEPNDLAMTAFANTLGNTPFTVNMIDYYLPFALCKIDMAINDSGKVDIGSINGSSDAAASLEIAAARLGNKASQNKFTGTITVRNIDDDADLYTVTLTDDGTNINRSIS